MSKLLGFIHGIDKCSTVDGPGLRYVVFLQGCGLQCAFCHNPDTWKYKEINAKTPDDIFNDFIKDNPSYTNMGLTISGGEPLLQLDFVLELAKKFHDNNIHICLETSGYCYDERNKSKYEELLRNIDLVYLDVKALSNKRFKALTKAYGSNRCKDSLKYGIEPTFDLLKLCDKFNVEVELHYVVLKLSDVVTGELTELKKIKNNNPVVTGIKLLPYHTKGVWKYKEHNLEYILSELKDLSYSDLKKAEQILKDVN